MKNNRRDFIKSAGIAGLSIGWLPHSPVPSLENLDEKDWSLDPEWRKIKYGDWGGPGIPPGPGPMDDVLLMYHAPISSVVNDKTFIPSAKYPVIDVHTHTYPGRGSNSPENLENWVRVQQEVGVEKTIVLTGATGERFDECVAFYLGKYPDQFQLYCGMESNGIASRDYPDRLVKELERCYRMGARGIGELTDKGYGLTGDRDLTPGERLHPDDPRLDDFWARAAELNLPVNIHIADHPSSWQPPDVFQERTPIFQRFNQHGSTGLSYGEQIDIFPRLLKKHPGTKFIACHLANLGNDLGRLAGMMDEFPNLYLDISARDYELGRTPRAAVAFLNRYRDRVMFGTDMGMDKSMYQAWWRLLESTDEYMTGRIWWPYYGLGLSSSLLKKMYRTNSLKILNWESV